MPFYILLALAPVAYGIYGLRTGELPVTSRRKLRDSDARRYAIRFIVFPLVIVLISAVLVILSHTLHNAGLLANVGICLYLCGLPLGLAVILNGATKQARRAMYKEK